MFQDISRWPDIVGAYIRSKSIPSEIYGEKKKLPWGRRFCQNFNFSCQYHSTIAPHSFTYHVDIQYNIKKWQRN